MKEECIETEKTQGKVVLFRDELSSREKERKCEGNVIQEIVWWKWKDKNKRRTWRQKAKKHNANKEINNEEIRVYGSKDSIRWKNLLMIDSNENESGTSIKKLQRNSKDLKWRRTWTTERINLNIIHNIYMSCNILIGRNSLIV